MGGQQQPYMYSPTNYDDVYNHYPSAPSKPFDPKAVTRASWEPAPRSPKKHHGPLVSFNQHPDTHVVPEPRNEYKLPGPRTKSWIKGLRIAQLCFRIFELIAAAGILFLFIIIDHVSTLTSWILRITAGVVMIHCAYAIFHLSRPAGARPPSSSAAYQTFASVTDLAVLPLYAYGYLSVHTSSGTWGTLLPNESLMDYFLPALSYTLFVGVVIHLISMVMGLWLALKFRQITRLPPDLNPLENNLTSRHHKKMSVATTATYHSAEGGIVSPEELRRSGMSYDGESQHPPSVPFHNTRSSPRNSFGSVDLPPRHYQIEAGNSPRNSISSADITRMTAGPPPPSSSHSSIAPAPPLRSPWRLSTDHAQDFRPPYGRTAVPTPPSPRSHHSRPSIGSTAHGPPSSAHHNPQAPPSPSQLRPAKFTEAWYQSESLFNRTHAKNRTTMPAGAYEAIRRRYDLSDDSDSDYEADTATAVSVAGYSVLSPPATEIEYNDDFGGDLATSPPPTHHPNPLRSNPSLSPISSSGGKGYRRSPKTPFVAMATPLSEIELNEGRASNRASVPATSRGGADIADEKPVASYGGLGGGASPQKKNMRGSSNNSKRHTWAPRGRNSSIQAEADFYSKPYGDLRASTPPVIVGADRQVSSGNDYDLSGMGGGQAAKRYFSFGKRNVSGKVVEEGRAVGYAH